MVALERICPPAAFAPFFCLSGLVDAFPGLKPDRPPLHFEPLFPTAPLDKGFAIVEFFLAPMGGLILKV